MNGQGLFDLTGNAGQGPRVPEVTLQEFVQTVQGRPDRLLGMKQAVKPKALQIKEHSRFHHGASPVS